MAFSEVRTFSEPAEYAAAIPNADVELTTSSPEPFAATVTGIRFKSLHMLGATVSQPHIMHMTPAEGRAYMTFHTEPGPGVYLQGMERISSSIARPVGGKSYFQRSVGPPRLGAISLPVEDIGLAGITSIGRELAPPSGRLIVTPRPSDLAKLLALHRAAGLLAAEAPEVLGHSEAARRLEQALIQSMVACINTSDISEDSSAQRRHSKIMRRFHQELEVNADRPIYILEIATAVGVSVRSLSVCCQEHLGMGPKQYLMLRRMNLARQALCRADPTVTTVTDVATEYGFWQFGRFAGDYKLLFGELPSVTLRR